LERRRRRAIELLQRGHPPVEVAGMLGVDRRTVRAWKAAYRKKGSEGIRARPAPGRPRKLRPAQARRLEAMLLRGAARAGFAGDLWTCARVAGLIRRRFGVGYHPCHVWRLLRSMGWSCQRPARRAIERDEAAIGQWVKGRWPALKKRPAGSART
jgi:transposase